MIRLRIEETGGATREVEFHGQTVTIGRGALNQLVLDHPGVSKEHGRLTFNQGHHLYVDLGSSNGTIVMQNGQALAITGKQVRGQAVEPGAILRIGPYRVRLENESAVFSDPTSTGEYEVEESIKMRLDSGGRGFLPSPSVSEQFVEFIQSTRATLNDQGRLLRVFREFFLRVFPQATHMFILVRDPLHGQLRPLLRSSRQKLDSNATVSRTLVHRVVDEETALLCGRGQASLGIQSMANIGIVGALCAPLRGTTGTYGVIQVDIRGLSQDSFDLGDLELLALIADFVGMVLEGRRVSTEERCRFQSSLDALLISMEGYEPQRVAAARCRSDWIKALGRRLRLHRAEVRMIRYATLLSAFKPCVVETLSYPPSLAALPEILRDCEPEAKTSGRQRMAVDLLAVADILERAEVQPIARDEDSISAAVADSLRSQFSDRQAAYLDVLTVEFRNTPEAQKNRDAA